MNNEPLVFHAPSNFKSGRLILNRYRVIDMIILIVGITISLFSIIMYVGVFKQNNILVVLVLLLPALIAFILTYSTGGIYHNVLVMLQLLFIYLRSVKVYQWEGIYKDDDEYTNIPKND